jgi:hypothetical protein
VTFNMCKQLRKYIKRGSHIRPLVVTKDIGRPSLPFSLESLDRPFTAMNDSPLFDDAYVRLGLLGCGNSGKVFYCIRKDMPSRTEYLVPGPEQYFDL